MSSCNCSIEKRNTRVIHPVLITGQNSDSFLKMDRKPDQGKRFCSLGRFRE
ncbi:hypothetical protein LEP1GSC047_1495 [Leptospira inadai serovar Lyme str. 10]|uniref:Uncharacterized protein n=1 Tax=Leptospira inadai serovar Lyme str. 10 TaxID=1049790 RepID=V6HRS0_9LEPT|nr:hypothetical protein LEP1GSC047_1495 [Leptospira inadai serovar Lyme str. 10]